METLFRAQLPLSSSSTILSLVFTLTFHCSILSLHYSIFDSENPFLQLQLISSSFYIFTFGASPPTTFIFVCCPGRWVIHRVRSLFSVSQGQFPPRSLLFFLLHLFWWALLSSQMGQWMQSGSHMTPTPFFLLLSSSSLLFHHSFYSFQLSSNISSHHIIGTQERDKHSTIAKMEQ